MNKDWLVVTLKEKYNSENEKNEFWNKLKTKYGKKSSEIYLFSKENNPGLSYYVFIKDECPSSLFLQVRNEKYVDNQFGYYEITSKEAISTAHDAQYYRDTVSFGDVIRVKIGKYKNLYGIVLRKNGEDSIDVGFKFCFGSVVETIKESEIEVVENIFKFIKINR